MATSSKLQRPSGDRAKAAARAWWVLRWAGVRDVWLLDGGVAAWSAAGFTLQRGEQVREPGNVTLEAGHMPVLDADAGCAAARAGTVLDARATERYRGETEPVDSRAGHIPGAKSAPTSENLTKAGYFIATEALRARFAKLGVRPGDEVTVYCGSGVTAAHQIAALAEIGVDAALYPGSWSAWSADPQRPAAVADAED